MNELFEYSDILRSPIEAFTLGSDNPVFPVTFHWHYFTEIIYCASGRVRVYCNGISRDLTPGDLVFVPPQYVHSLLAVSEEDSFSLHVMKFNLSKVPLSGNYLPSPETFFQNAADHKAVRLFFSSDEFPHVDAGEFFRACIREISEKKYGYDSYVYSCIAGFFVRLLRIWHEEPHTTVPAKVPPAADQAVRSILPYIDANCGQKISIQELARKCNMSYSNFARCFRTYYGQSCKSYIEFVRLSRAENLLLFTDYDLNYIAEETGFADCSHLIRSFKKKYGTTPKQYRISHS